MRVPASISVHQRRDERVLSPLRASVGRVRVPARCACDPRRGGCSGGRAQARAALAHQGVCSACSGRMRASLVSGSEKYFGQPLHALYECGQYEFHHHATLSEVVLDHPTVVSLFHDYGSIFDRCRGDRCRGGNSASVSTSSTSNASPRSHFESGVSCEGVVLGLTLGETGRVIGTARQCIGWCLLLLARLNSVSPPRTLTLRTPRFR